MLRREKEELDKRRRKAEEESEEGGEAYRKGKLTVAAKHYTQAIALATPVGGGCLAKYRCNRAAARLEGGDHEGCLEDCDAALGILERMPEGAEDRAKLGARALGRKGLALKKLGRRKLAVECLMAALELDEDSEKLIVALAELQGGASAGDLRAKAGQCAARGDVEEAMRWMDEAIKVPHCQATPRSAGVTRMHASKPSPFYFHLFQEAAPCGP